MENEEVLVEEEFQGGGVVKMSNIRKLAYVLFALLAIFLLGVTRNAYFGGIPPVIVFSAIVLCGLLFGQSVMKDKFRSSLYSKNTVDIDGAKKLYIVPVEDEKSGFVFRMRGHNDIFLWPDNYITIPLIKRTIFFTGAQMVALTLIAAFLIMITKEYYREHYFGYHLSLFSNPFLEMTIDGLIVIIVFIASLIMGTHIVKRKLTCTWSLSHERKLTTTGAYVVIPWKEDIAFADQNVTFVLHKDELPRLLRNKNKDVEMYLRESLDKIKERLIN